MSRTLKYILTIILLIVAAMWILTVYRTCQAKKLADNTELSTNNGTNPDDDSNSEGEGEMDDKSGSFSKQKKEPYQIHASYIVNQIKSRLWM